MQKVLYTSLKCKKSRSEQFKLHTSSSRLLECSLIWSAGRSHILRTQTRLPATIEVGTKYPDDDGWLLNFSKIKGNEYFYRMSETRHCLVDTNPLPAASGLVKLTSQKQELVRIWSRKRKVMNKFCDNWLLEPKSNFTFPTESNMGLKQSSFV